jgi:hypothetical protein
LEAAGGASDCYHIGGCSSHATAAITMNHHLLNRHPHERVCTVLWKGKHFLLFVSLMPVLYVLLYLEDITAKWNMVLKPDCLLKVTLSFT